MRLLIVQAAERGQVVRFMAGIAGEGSAQVLPARSAEEAVARGGCLAETA